MKILICYQIIAANGGWMNGHGYADVERFTMSEIQAAGHRMLKQCQSEMPGQLADTIVSTSVNRLEEE
jgi:hypothetical protein